MLDSTVRRSEPPSLWAATTMLKRIRKLRPEIPEQRKRDKESLRVAKSILTRSAYVGKRPTGICRKPHPRSGDQAHSLWQFGSNVGGQRAARRLYERRGPMAEHANREMRGVAGWDGWDGCAAVWESDEQDGPAGLGELDEP